jgi:chromosomal replication initiator protein
MYLISVPVEQLMNVEQAWQSVLGQLQMEMPRASFDTWVRDTKPVSYQDGTLTIGVRNAYARDWLESRLASTVSRLLIGIMNASVAVNFIVCGSDPEIVMDEAPITQPSSSPELARRVNSLTAPATTLALAGGARVAPEARLSARAGMSQAQVLGSIDHGYASQPESVEDYDEPARPSSMNPRYLFETFVVGSGNRLAHAACLAVAEKPARAYNPLFLYGGVGLGKTHLLHAIGNACHARGLNVLYVSSEEFTNDMITAIRTHTNQAFREKYRSADVLLVDDIQFIAGKESTQEEFFHTFNTLHGQDKQIIVSSDRPPKSLVTLDERLRSRFEWGLTADIQPPDLETRLAILRSKAERTGRQVPDEILEIVARRVQSNIRELEGALNRILAFADLSGAHLTSQLVEVALADLLPQRSDVQPQKIIELVAKEWQTTVEALIGRDRSQKIAQPRQVAMYLLRKETDASLPQIGEVLGGRDHTTVMYAIEKIASDIETKTDLRKRVVNIKQQLYGQGAVI